MKIFIITLMLFVFKGFETRTLPVKSDPSQVEHLPEPVRPLKNIQNFSAIFANVPNNIPAIIQQRMEALGSQFEEQAGVIRDKLVFLLSQFQRENEDTLETPTSSFRQQLEAFKRNISEWAVNAVPANTSQIFQDKFQEDLNQKMEQLQQIFLPLINRFQDSFIEGIENLRKSVSPEVHEIKKIVTGSKSV